MAIDRPGGVGIGMTKSVGDWFEPGRARNLLALPPPFIQLRLESGGCWHHTRLQPRAKARSHCGAQRLGPVAMRMLWRRWLAQASRCENAAEPYYSRSAILRAPGAPASVM